MPGRLLAALSRFNEWHPTTGCTVGCSPGCLSRAAACSTPGVGGVTCWCAWPRPAGMCSGWIPIPMRAVRRPVAPPGGPRSPSGSRAWPTWTDDSTPSSWSPCCTTSTWVEALRRIRTLLLPGGRLLVVGLARPAGPVDAVLDGASLLLNPVVGRLVQPFAPPCSGRTQVVAVPTKTLAEICGASRLLLGPGVVVRRHLFWRYTLEWTAPG